jgi:hypothetical protein
MTCRTQSACIAVGSEMSGGVYGVTATDIDCLQAGQGLNIKSTLGRGGAVAGVTFADVRMGAVGTALVVTDGYGDQVRGERQRVGSRARGARRRGGAAAAAATAAAAVAAARCGAAAQDRRGQRRQPGATSGGERVGDPTRRARALSYRHYLYRYRPYRTAAQYPPCPVNASLVPRLGSIAIANISAVGGVGSIGAAGEFVGLGPTAEEGGIAGVTLRDVDLSGAAVTGWVCANVTGSSAGVVLPAPCPQLAVAPTAPPGEE